MIPSTVPLDVSRDLEKTYDDWCGPSHEGALIRSLIRRCHAAESQREKLMIERAEVLQKASELVE